MLQPFDVSKIELKPGQVKKVWVDPEFLREFGQKIGGYRMRSPKRLRQPYILSIAAAGTLEAKWPLGFLLRPAVPQRHVAVLRHRQPEERKGSGKGERGGKGDSRAYLRPPATRTTA